MDDTLFGSCGVSVGCCAVKASSVVSCYLRAVAVVLFAGSSSESKIYPCI